MSWMRHVLILVTWAALAGALAAQRPPAPINPSVPPPPPEETPVNPYLAEKSFEIGKYYLKMKNYDAAIARFQDAIGHKPDHARAHMLIGEAHEKKGELRQAVIYYKRFLEILPGAPEAGNVKKKIEKLEAKLPKAKESGVQLLKLPLESAG